jgi:transcriptional regulator with XRE-family HTH domain
MNKGEKKEIKKGNVISVANLPKDFLIDDPQDYIRFMRTTYLKKTRASQDLSINEVSRNTGIDKDELIRIESGQVNEQDMMALSKLCELYDIDYPGILFMFKLARRPERQKIEKMAAYHDQKMDEETQKELVDFLSKLKDSIE